MKCARHDVLVTTQSSSELGRQQQQQQPLPLPQPQPLQQQPLQQQPQHPSPWAQTKEGAGQKGRTCAGEEIGGAAPTSISAAMFLPSSSVYATSTRLRKCSCCTLWHAAHTCATATAPINSHAASCSPLPIDPLRAEPVEVKPAVGLTRPDRLTPRSCETRAQHAHSSTPHCTAAIVSAHGRYDLSPIAAGLPRIVVPPPSASHHAPKSAAGRQCRWAAKPPCSQLAPAASCPLALLGPGTAAGRRSSPDPFTITSAGDSQQAACRVFPPRPA